MTGKFSREDKWMTESPESKMGKAALHDAAGIESHDPGVRGFQNLGGAAAGAGGGLGIVLLIAIFVPFWGYYIAYLDTFTTMGYDIAHFARREMVRNPYEFREENEVGLLFANRFLDAAFLFVAIGLLYFLLSPRVGYFVIVGITLIPFLGVGNSNASDMAVFGLLLPAILYFGAWLLNYPKFTLPVWISCVILAAITSVLLALSPNYGLEIISPSTAVLFVLGFLAFSTLTWLLSKGAIKLWEVITGFLGR
jgi:hypothetical protein